MGFGAFRDWASSRALQMGENQAFSALWLSPGQPCPEELILPLDSPTLDSPPEAQFWSLVAPSCRAESSLWAPARSITGKCRPSPPPSSSGDSVFPSLPPSPQIPLVCPAGRTVGPQEIQVLEPNQSESKF